MDRRAFIGSFALATLAAPRAVPAQPARKVARIGIISFGQTAPMIGPLDGSEARVVPFTAALLRGLRELGYMYGRDFVTEPRGTEGRPERLVTVAAELVGLQVDVIVAGGSAATVLRQATSTIPVVLVQARDPVGEGYARRLARPGGNVTGISSAQVAPKGKHP